METLTERRPASRPVRLVILLAFETLTMRRSAPLLILPLAAVLVIGCDSGPAPAPSKTQDQAEAGATTGGAKNKGVKGKVRVKKPPASEAAARIPKGRPDL